MSEFTPKLSMPLIMPSQAQKHVTHNEAVELLDMIVQLTVEGVDESVPPGAPAEGQSWLLGSTTVGDWSGQEGNIASWRGGGWLFVAPQTGWMAWDTDSDSLKVYTDGAWATLAAVTT